MLQPLAQRLPALLLLALAAPLAASGPAVQSTLFDDLKGRWINHEVGTLQPFAFGSDPARAYVVNQPGARVFEVDLESLHGTPGTPVGPGLASIALRPGSAELWCVDRVTSSVGVVNAVTGTMERSIRVGAQPHGIVFSESGDRAYVTCAADDRVDVIDAGSYEVERSIAIPAKSPRGIARIGDVVYVVPLLSGNGSVPRGNPDTGWTDDVVDVRRPEDYPGTNPLPDRDLLAIQMGSSPQNDALDPSRTVTGLGTILYNVRTRPGTSELWIPHTEALNTQFRGEKSYVEGQVVQNRIAIVDTTQLGQGANEDAVTIVDLDALTPYAAARCATPTDVAFTRDGGRAFVCGYGSDSIAVLDMAGAQVQWSGTIFVKTAGKYPDGVGPRSLAVSPDGRWLVIHSKGQNTLTRVDLRLLPSGGGFGFSVGVDDSAELGWDPTPVDIVQGRIHFRRAGNSLSKTSSCDSCHVDGDTDGIAWDLGKYLDPEGVAPDRLSFPLDAKGPMVTQSLRRMKEVGPYHWRGERKELVEFDNTFVDLLERHEGSVVKKLGPNFRYITQYMEHLAIPPNPRQLRSRQLSSDQAQGLNLFLNEPVLDGLTCNDCHTLPLGTRGEIVDNLGGGAAPTGVVPQLRGVADKLSPPFLVGGDFGLRTELGAGLGHGGAVPSLLHLLEQELPPPQSGSRLDVSIQEATQLIAFLEVFDTGMAPAAVWQATANEDNHSTFVFSDLGFLHGQAQAGHCDVVYRYGPMDWNGEQVFYTGLYRPESNDYLPPSETLPPVSTSSLLALAESGIPVTFLGVPPLMGWPMGLDRDNDKLFDLDEKLLGTDPEDDDTDNDGYPDGYERLWGMNPTQPSASSPDNDSPQGVGSVRVVYVTTNAVKFEWETSEVARALVSYNGGVPVLRAPLKPRQDDAFSEVVSELEPDTDYQFRIHLTDPSGNQGDVYFDVHTLPFVLPEPARVAEILLNLNQGPGGTTELRARVTMALGAGLPAAGYMVRTVAYYVSDDESLMLDLGTPSQTTGPAGNALFQVPLPGGLPTGQGSLYFAVQGADPPPGAPVYAEGYDTQSHAAIDY